MSWESDLINEYLDGNNTALEQLIAQHLDVVYRMAYSYLRNQDEAEDVAQEVFVRMWQHIRTFNQTKNFKSWLLGITHHAAIDAIRKKKKYLPFSAFEADNDDPGSTFSNTIADESPLPLEELIRQEQAETIRVAISQLSPAGQILINLYYFEELNMREISLILNQPLNTVKSRYRRAIAQLRGIMHQNKT